jgi:hypothetical protein
MKNKIYIILIGLGLASVCSAQKEIKVTVSSESVSTGYIGNGVEWDPYDEAESWGASLSEADWQKLFTRLDFMHPAYVRCMINSPYRYYDYRSGKYDKTRNIQSISRLLRYCTDHNITVVYGEYNPPKRSMKDSPEWVDMSVDYLNYLVNECGFNCIKYFVIFNEPDGDWAYPDGDYELWKSMILRFHDKMAQYPGLTEKVQLAAPDVVMEYKNPNSKYDARQWLRQTAQEADSVVGVYDIHAYPGQSEVRKGDYAGILSQYRQAIPENKKIILGEAGFKYWRTADSLLMKEFNRRLKGNPLTKGTDANLFVYDTFYGLDMALLCVEVMNGGFSGMAAWMLDDAMHSNSDSGKPNDIKLWGMWNILGEEVFHDASQEEIRPWYYAWSLLCRYFPAGSTILKTTFDRTQGVYIAVAEQQDRYTMAAVNVGHTAKSLNITFPSNWGDASLYVYNEKQSIPLELKTTVKKTYRTTIPEQSFILLTNMFQK